LSNEVGEGFFVHLSDLRDKAPGDFAVLVEVIAHEYVDFVDRDHVVVVSFVVFVSVFVLERGVGNELFVSLDVDD
jgi:hypothetical protein